MQRGFRRLRVWSTVNRSSFERQNRRSVHIQSNALCGGAWLRPILTYRPDVVGQAREGRWN